MSKSNVKLPKLCIGSIPIKAVDSKKFLGVIFDRNLSWKPHINFVISKLNSCLGATKRARPFLNKSALFFNLSCFDEKSCSILLCNMGCLGATR